MWNIFDIFVFLSGFVVSIYTWPWLRAKFLGAEAEAQKLRDRASAILAKARGTV
jgi:hypothetical protein